LGSAVWDRLKAGFQSFGASFNLIWAAIGVAFAETIGFMGRSVSNLLHGLADVAAESGLEDTTIALKTAAGELGAATGGLAANAKMDLEAARVELDLVVAAADDANAKIKSLVTGETEVQGSEDAVARSVTLEEAKQAAISSVINLAESERASVSFKNTLAAATQEINAEAKLIADTETAKTEMALVVGEERNTALLEQQSAYLNQFGNAEATAVKQNQELWASGMRGRAKVVGGVLNQISGLMSSGNKKQFEIGKAAAIGSTSIATVEASMQAYKSLAGIPIVGPALGIAAAAAATLSGINAVNQIRSQSFGGGGSPSFSGGGGGGGAVSSAQADVAPAAEVGGVGGTAIVINAGEEGALLDGRKVVELINQAQSDGALIQSIRIGTTNV
jgi:hypothetical protein